MADFKALPIDVALTRLNKHLLSLKDVAGRLEDNFKNDEFEFSYSLLKKTVRDLGIIVDGKNYVAYKVGEQPLQPPRNVVKSKQDLTNFNNVKQEVVKPQQDAIFTAEEITFLKQLYQEHKNDLVKPSQEVVKPLLVVPQMSGTKKQTGISVYAEVWDRWSEFKKEHSMYSGTDLLTMALEEFMDKYGK